MCVFFHRVWFSSKHNHIHVTRDGFFNWDQIPNSAHNSINHPSDFEERSKLEICIINVNTEMDFEKRKLGCIRETKVQRSKMEICQIRLFELDASAFNQYINEKGWVWQIDTSFGKKTSKFKTLKCSK